MVRALGPIVAFPATGSSPAQCAVSRHRQHQPTSMPNLLTKSGNTASVATAADAVVLDLSSLPVGAFTSPVAVDGDTLTPRGLHSSAPTIMVGNGLKVLAAFNGGSQGDDTVLTRADGRSFTRNAVDIGLLPDYGSTGQAVSAPRCNVSLSNVAAENHVRNRLRRQQVDRSRCHKRRLSRQHQRQRNAPRAGALDADDRGFRPDRLRCPPSHAGGPPEIASGSMVRR